MIIIDLLKFFLVLGKASEGRTGLEAISAIWDKPGSDKNCGSWSGTQCKGIGLRKIRESALQLLCFLFLVHCCFWVLCKVGQGVWVLLQYASGNVFCNPCPVTFVTAWANSAYSHEYALKWYFSKTVPNKDIPLFRWLSFGTVFYLALSTEPTHGHCRWV